MMAVSRLATLGRVSSRQQQQQITEAATRGPPSLAAHAGLVETDTTTMAAPMLAHEVQQTCVTSDLTLAGTISIGRLSSMMRLPQGKVLLSPTSRGLLLPQATI